MKNLKDIILEKLKINSKSKVNEIPKYNYHPITTKGLQRLIKKLIKERGYDADLNDIDTSKITNMRGLVSNNNDFVIGNIQIDKWDVSNVTNMRNMFFGCKAFNCDISNWDVSNVENMTAMFYRCSSFNQDLSKWDVSNVKKMECTFDESPLEKNPPKWYKK